MHLNYKKNEKNNDLHCHFPPTANHKSGATRREAHTFATSTQWHVDHKYFLPFVLQTTTSTTETSKHGLLVSVFVVVVFVFDLARMYHVPVKADRSIQCSPEILFIYRKATLIFNLYIFDYQV